MESPDTNEKLCGLIGVKAYSEILVENEVLPFVNSLIENIYRSIILGTESLFIQFGVKVYGILVRLGGINISQQIEENVNQCMSNVIKQDKKLTALVILVELLRHAQFITFNKIRRFDYVETFRHLINEKDAEIRKYGLQFIEECIKESCKRDSKSTSQRL